MSEHSRRSDLKRQYTGAYEKLAALLFEVDPIGISFDDNSDEYEPEAGTILPQLRSCRSVEDVRRVVHKEFVRWFDSETAGPEQNYEFIAQRIWQDVLPGLSK